MDRTSQYGELFSRLKAIKAAFGFDMILDRPTTQNSEVERYYRFNKLAYKAMHSPAGFVHMGISTDGTFKPADLLAQAATVEERIEETAADSALELGAGQRTNLYYLAPRNPRTMFYGMDLPNGQFELNTKRFQNIGLQYGDFNNLNGYPESSMDIVYAVEALCYAVDKRQVISEVSRVLRPGGHFMVFDGYTARPRDKMKAIDRLASELTFKSMMVDTTDLCYSNFRDKLRKGGFDIYDERDISNEVLPSMRRLESRSQFLIKHPHVTRAFNYAFSDIVSANAVAGYLMPLTTDMGIHRYWYTDGQKITSNL